MNHEEVVKRETFCLTSSKVFLMISCWLTAFFVFFHVMTASVYVFFLVTIVAAYLSSLANHKALVAGRILTYGLVAATIFSWVGFGIPYFQDLGIYFWPNGFLCFLFIGLSLWSTKLDEKKSVSMRELFALITLFLALPAFALYFLGTRLDQHLGLFRESMLANSVATMLIAFSILFSRPKSGFLSNMIDQGVAAGIMRKAFGFALFTPALFAATALFTSNSLNLQKGLATSWTITFCSAALTLGLLKLGRSHQISEYERESIKNRLYEIETRELRQKMMAKVTAVEDELFESREQLGLLVTAIPQLVLIFDAGGLVESVNQQWTSYTGLTKKDSAYFGWTKALFEDDRDACVEEWRKAVRSQTSFQCEFRLVSSENKKARWHLMHTVPVRDSAGRVIRWFGACTDVHEQRLISNEIKMLKQRNDAIVDNIDAMLWAVDRNGVFTFAEGRGYRTNAIDKSEMIGRSIYDLYSNDPVIIVNIQRVMNGFVGLKAIKKRDDKVYECHYSPIVDESGNIIGVAGVVMNITERVALEEQRTNALVREQTAIAASKLKTEFLARASHELRTPLNAIAGYCDLLTGSKLEREQRESVRVIRQSTDELLYLINDLLDYTKNSAAELKIEKSEFNLHDMVNFVSSQIVGVQNQTRCTFSKNLASNLPVWFEGDVMRLSQILRNLLSNAYKFTPEGNIELKVSRTKNGNIYFAVTDSGVGIANESKEKIFQPFTRVQDKSWNAVPGTGLGLAICKQLVELMNGNIGFESEVGKGSTFWFEIPLTEVSLAKNIDLGKTTKTPTLSKRAYRILVAEDNEVSQKMALKQLHKLGYSACAVDNGADVVKRLQQEHFDLVLMDCEMPELDGFEATRSIRSSTSPKNQKIPIIGLSANAHMDDGRNWHDVGMNDYLTKPVSLNSLSSVLGKWLNQP